MFVFLWETRKPAAMPALSAPVTTAVGSAEAVHG